MVIHFSSNLACVPVVPDTYGQFSAYEVVFDEYDYDFEEFDFEKFRNALCDEWYRLFTRDIEVKGFTPKGITEYCSPREYNFHTDSCSFDVEVDEDAVDKESYLHDNGFAEFLKNEFSPRDGFIPFWPSRVSDIKDDEELLTLIYMYESHKAFEEDASLEEDWYETIISNLRYIDCGVKYIGNEE